MRQLLSLFFVLVFSAFLATPTFVILVDTSAEISFVHHATEEEKTHNERFVDESESKQINKLYAVDSNHFGLHTNHNLNAPQTLWSAVYFEINSPPPETV